MKYKIRIENFSVIYDNDKKTLTALKDLSFNVKHGEFICVLGPSGCGKTTLLHCLSGILKPSEGKITIDGKIIVKPNSKTKLVFQDSLLLPWRNILGNITFGLELQKIGKVKAENKARKILSLLNLSEFETYYPHQLSGGMKQRVNLGRALVCDPEILLLDEPFAHLDAQTRELMQQEVLNIFKKTKKTFIFVTHNIDEAIFLGQKIIVLSKRPGKVKEIIEINKKNKSKTVKNHIWNLIKNEVQI